MKKIELTKGFYALVDDEDFEYLNQFKWHATKCCLNYYAKRVDYGGGKYRKVIYMHREIMGVINSNKNIVCDHRDLNTLNNQKNNLRVCSQQQNIRRKRKKENATSKYLGVIKIKNGMYVAQMTHNGKHLYIGRFKNEIDAAKAYDKKKLELHGYYSVLNFPE